MLPNLIFLVTCTNLPRIETFVRKYSLLAGLGHNESMFFA